MSSEYVTDYLNDLAEQGWKLKTMAVLKEADSLSLYGHREYHFVFETEE